MNPFATIITVCYNSSATIERTILSVLNPRLKRINCVGNALVSFNSMPVWHYLIRA